MARKKKNERIFDELTRGVSLTARQAQSVRSQIAKGVKSPTLTVAGVRNVTLGQLRTAADLFRDEENFKGVKEVKPPATPLRFRKGVATTKTGVKITREEAKLYTRQQAQINKYLQTQQLRSTLLNIRAYEKKNTATTQFYPSRVRRAPFAPREVDFQKFRSREQFLEALGYQQYEYDTRTGASPRAFSNAEALRWNWAKALISQVGHAVADEIIYKAYQLTAEQFKDLLDSGDVKSAGDIYNAVPSEVFGDAERMNSLLSQAVKRRRRSKITPDLPDFEATYASFKSSLFDGLEEVDYDEVF